MIHLFQNVSTTHSLTIPVERKHITTLMMSDVTVTRCRPAGTDSAERRDSKCLNPVSQCGVVLRMRRAGSVEVILQWPKGLFGSKCVTIGQVTAVGSQITSMSVTVEGSTFTILKTQSLAHIVTAVTDYKVQ